MCMPVSSHEELTLARFFCPIVSARQLNAYHESGCSRRPSNGKALMDLRDAVPAHGNLALPLGQRQDTERWSVDSEPREGKRIVMGEKRDRDVDSLFCQVHTPSPAASVSSGSWPPR
jgi:hypothetical protein